MKSKNIICLIASILAFCACTAEDPTLNPDKGSLQMSSISVVYTIDTISSTADLAKKSHWNFPSNQQLDQQRIKKSKKY